MFLNTLPWEAQRNKEEFELSRDPRIQWQNVTSILTMKMLSWTLQISEILYVQQINHRSRAFRENITSLVLKKAVQRTLKEYVRFAYPLHIFITVLVYLEKADLFVGLLLVFTWTETLSTQMLTITFHSLLSSSSSAVQTLIIDVLQPVAGECVPYSFPKPLQVTLTGHKRLQFHFQV